LQSRRIETRRDVQSPPVCEDQLEAVIRPDPRTEDFPTNSHPQGVREGAEIERAYERCSAV